MKVLLEKKLCYVISVIIRSRILKPQSVLSLGARLVLLLGGSFARRGLIWSLCDKAFGYVWGSSGGHPSRLEFNFLIRSYLFRNPKLFLHLQVHNLHTFHGWGVLDIYPTPTLHCLFNGTLLTLQGECDNLKIILIFGQFPWW